MASDWAAILTALVATVAYGRYWLAQRACREALETYLKEEKRRATDEGRRSVMHLMANLAMTEAEVLHAGFRSDRIKAVPGVDERGRAVRLYFEYVAKDLPMSNRF
ncbi:hypothetical protein [uncultured Novosphingobium sp.]|uniref:hypothetical protein n=1 Tax=Novosphingobium sp. YAF33 TaxID=3233082 RepID=UPI0028D8E926|nr:hypothetical protein [uncultured Novosphingobium sp.]